MPLQKDVAGPGGEGRGEGEKKEKKKGVEKERRIDDPAAGGRALRCICESRGTFRMSGGAREREREDRCAPARAHSPERSFTIERWHAGEKKRRRGGKPIKMEGRGKRERSRATTVTRLKFRLQRRARTIVL
jgi:hypothetical protein